MLSPAVTFYALLGLAALGGVALLMLHRRAAAADALARARAVANRLLELKLSDREQTMLADYVQMTRWRDEQSDKRVDAERALAMLREEVQEFLTAPKKAVRPTPKQRKRSR